MGGYESYFALFVAAFLASLSHCIPMCGGIALGLNIKFAQKLKSKETTQNLKADSKEKTTHNLILESKESTTKDLQNLNLDSKENFNAKFTEISTQNLNLDSKDSKTTQNLQDLILDSKNIRKNLESKMESTQKLKVDSKDSNATQLQIDSKEKFNAKFTEISTQNLNSKNARNLKAESKESFKIESKITQDLNLESKDSSAAHKLQDLIKGNAKSKNSKDTQNLAVDSKIKMESKVKFKDNIKADSKDSNATQLQIDSKENTTHNLILESKEKIREDSKDSNTTKDLQNLRLDSKEKFNAEFTEISTQNLNLDSKDSNKNIESIRFAQILANIIYFFGRSTSYICIGLFFSLVSFKIGFNDAAHAIMLIILGILLFLFSLFTTFFPFLGQHFSLNAFKDSKVYLYYKKFFKSTLKSHSLKSFFIIGFLNGLLPCHLVYMFALSAAMASSLLGSLITMGLFCIATFLPLFVIGIFSSAFLTSRFKSFYLNLSFVIMTYFAFSNIYNGVSFFKQDSVTQNIESKHHHH